MNERRLDDKLMTEIIKNISELTERVVVVDNKVDTVKIDVGKVDEKVNDHLKYHWDLKEQRAKEKQDNEEFKEQVLKTLEKLTPVIQAWETIQNNKKGLGFMAGVVGSITIIGAGVIWLASWLIKVIR